MGEEKASRDEFDAQMKALGIRVRTLRQDRGWGAGVLAQRADLHWTYVREIETGKRKISVVTLLKLASGLDVDPCELLRAALSPPTTQDRRSR